MRYLLFLFIIVSLNGCLGSGHQGWVEIKNNIVGGELMHYKPYRYENSGKLMVKLDKQFHPKVHITLLKL